ncbi:uncharacterized protein DUF4245 [Halopolyspora algeriensis]|uniref:Uncharacterized protein DUF4245 n=1 Tax=Halopolyspora algeriensis TaxID=1500506 RepID=A0A368VFW7_9ACTN|nr:DUF4245 domain-containing protein [Halopolyspora algeriensis]RCW40040.1 uncharacterized protein DUF4245 [Halopolyspora algeriensis]
MRGVTQQRNQQAAGVRPTHPVRSMLFTMLPLALIVLGIAGITGQCSFSPLGPSTEPGSAPTVDASAELRRASARVDFPVVEPRLPSGWRANSADVGSVESGTQAVRVGWLTGGAHYMRLSQSPAAEAELVAFETGRTPRAQGVVRAADTRWVVYDSVRTEKAWVAERDGVRLLITGSGTEQEFRILARSALSAPVVTPQR